MRIGLLALVAIAVLPLNGADPEQLRSIHRTLDADVTGYWGEYTRQNPSDAWGWHYLGVAFAEAGSHGDAEAAFLRAADLDPADAGHRLQLANFYSRAGRPRQALDQLNAAEEREADPRRRQAMRESQRDLRRILDDIDRSRSRQVWTGGALGILVTIGIVWFRRWNG